MKNWNALNDENYKLECEVKDRDVKIRIAEERINVLLKKIKGLEKDPSAPVIPPNQECPEIDECESDLNICQDQIDSLTQIVRKLKFQIDSIILNPPEIEQPEIPEQPEQPTCEDLIREKLLIIQLKNDTIAALNARPVILPTPCPEDENCDDAIREHTETIRIQTDTIQKLRNQIVALSRPCPEIEDVEQPEPILIPEYFYSSANLNFNCPNQMTKDEIYSVDVSLADLIPNSEFRKALYAQLGINEEGNTEIESIDLQNLIRINLNSQEESAFKITPLHTEQSQVMGSNMKGWKWEVTPLVIAENKRLNLEVLLKDLESDDFRTISSKSLDINISDYPESKPISAFSFFRKNPFWPILGLLLPLLAFILGYLMNSKKKSPSDESKSDEADDLEVIEGIGPKIEQLLYNEDIKTYDALAKTDVSMIQEILDKAGPDYRIHEPTTWPEQSALAADGKWKKLIKWQNKLHGGKDL